jgi:hypothetical protein
VDGTANTGGGGGGGITSGGAGGSGVVIIRFPTDDIDIVDSTGADITTDGADTILTYNASGTFQFTNAAAGGGGFVPFPHPRGMHGGAHVLNGGMQ